MKDGLHEQYFPVYDAVYPRRSRLPLKVYIFTSTAYNLFRNWKQRISKNRVFKWTFVLSNIVSLIVLFIVTFVEINKGYFILNLVRYFYNSEESVGLSLTDSYQFDVKLVNFVCLLGIFVEKHKLCFICPNVQINASCCLLLSIHRTFSLGRCVGEKP